MVGRGGRIDDVDLWPFMDNEGGEFGRMGQYFYDQNELLQLVAQADMSREMTVEAGTEDVEAGTEGADG